jgi:hypothetical protein
VRHLTRSRVKTLLHRAGHVIREAAATIRTPHRQSVPELVYIALCLLGMVAMLVFAVVWPV